MSTAVFCRSRRSKRFSPYPRRSCSEALEIRSTVAAIIEQRGWIGDAGDVRCWGLLDDARFLRSEPNQQEPAAATLQLSAPGAGPRDGEAWELVVRSQRLQQGRPSGTGPAPLLTVVIHAGEEQIGDLVAGPGGSWRMDRVVLPAGIKDWSDLRVSLLLPPGPREVGVSLVAVVVSDEPAPPAEVAAAPEVVVCPMLTATAVEEEKEEEEEESEKVSKPRRRRRARHDNGQYRGNDPATAVNEAWECV